MQPESLILLIFTLNIFLLFFLTFKIPQITIHGFHIEPYSVAALTGPILLLSFGLIGLGDVLSYLRNSGNASPLGILVLFLSMVFMSIFLDNVGFMEFCAKLALKGSGTDGRRLFFKLYFAVSILTIFTSNDIIILTMTPFIYYLSKHMKMNPLPLLIAEFFAANTWSMMLYIGNPTNIFVASAFGIGFIEYTRLMVLPTVFSGIASLGLLYLIFRKDIDVKIIAEDMDPYESLKDRQGAMMGMVLLALCIIGIAVAPYLGIEMWHVALAFATVLGIILAARDVKRKESYLASSISRMPWSVVPFLLSFFVMAGALSGYGMTGRVGDLISRSADGSIPAYVSIYGIGSAISANFLNNIPMTIVFTSMLSGLSGDPLTYSSLAVIIGSNIGANLTPIGALAGIMWMSILKHKKMSLSFFDFMKYGIAVNVISLLIALGTLCLLVL